MDNDDRQSDDGQSDDGQKVGRQKDRAGGSAVAWPANPPAPSHCGYWLRSAERGLSKALGRLLTQCGIIASEWVALRTMYGPQWRSPVELGCRIGMSKGGASKLITRLVKKGLFHKRQHEFDRRFRSIALTAQGRALVIRLAAVEKDIDREFFQPLGHRRTSRLKQWLAPLLDQRHLRRMRERISAWIQQHGILPVDPDAQARAGAQARAEADALWDQLKRLREAVAYGRPPPPMPGL
jgi:DNA-binding MarR family transcriptional regulator